LQEQTWYQKNRKLSIARAKQWALDNPEKVKERYQKKKDNPEFKRQRKEYILLWNANNKNKINLYASIRRKRHKQATPKCLTEWDQLFLSEIYDLAPRRNMVVDHIIPLVHPLVCGLHVPENLQLLSVEENSRKNNFFEVYEC
jgi:5-methylcytosine-specific restriction endonuclease McrA